MNIEATFAQNLDPNAGLEYAARQVGYGDKKKTITVSNSWSDTASSILESKYFRRAQVPSATIKVEEDGVPEWLQRSIPAAGATFGGETDARQVFHRLAGCWTYWGWVSGMFSSEADAKAYYADMFSILANQIGAPNSPQWFNTGLYWAYGITGPAQGHYYVDHKTGELLKSPDAYGRPAPHACFINGISDNLIGEAGIMDSLTREALIFKFGAGSGMNFSSLRGAGEKLSGGGTSSGLMSFLKVFDRAAGAIKSGGTTRRAAKMVVLNADHPDIEEFVTWKSREEGKVADLVAGSMIREKRLNAILSAAHDASIPEADRFDVSKNVGLKTAIKEAKRSFIPGGAVGQVIALAQQGVTSIDVPVFDTGWQSEAYESVSGQNSNNSVRVTDEFMKAVAENAEWNLKARTNGETVKTINAKNLWDKIALAAWQSADPGMQFDTTYNDWHTCPADGRINATNPCVTGDTLVSTADGPARIASLVGKSAFVIGADGKPHFVSKIFPTGTKQTYRLTTKSGYSVTLTGDHKVYTENRGDVPASNLLAGDKIVLNGSGFGSKSLDGNVAFAMGIAVGDGCTGHYDGRDYLQVTMAPEEIEIVEAVATTINAIKSESTDGRTARRVTATIPQTTARLTTTAKDLIALFETYAVLDKGSENKILTDAVYGLDKASVAALLRGLFTADGTVANNGEKNQYVSLDSTSLTLLEQVQHMLLSFGIKAKIYKNRRAGATVASLPDGKGGMTDYNVQEMHALRISRSSRIAFENEIGFDQASDKTRKLREMNAEVGTYADKMTDEFASLVALDVEKVYDLTEPETSHFVANGLVVHNCSEYAFLDDTACNLASINLVKFLLPNGKFDAEKFAKACRLWTLTLEISVTMSQLPAKTVAQRTFDYRTLGLGFANIGTLLMRMGLPYESEEGRNRAAAITAIMHGVANLTSAEIAGEVGPFARYDANKEHMLRVMRNHRRAAYALTDGYENVSITPVVYQPNDDNQYLWAVARATWDDVLRLGGKNGFRNAQVTVVAPTGTIGLVMDCDTTGIEPDFSLMKYKTLAGGGSLKIINQSVPQALENLGYSAQQITDIVTHAQGTGKFTPAIADELRALGISQEKIDTIESTVGFTINLNMAAGQQKVDLGALGMSAERIEQISDIVWGTMMIEGAPGIKAEHLAVFDCANKCGFKGTRFISAKGHIDMMAATQPFLSGSISKTVNLPNSATIEEIAEAYRYSWSVGVKAVAVYRDGSKLSQPLSSNFDVDVEEVADMPTAAKAVVMAENILKMGQKRKMPKRAGGYRQKFSIGGHDVYLHTGEYEDGSLGEIFLSMSKEGAAFRALMNNFAIAISMGLQYGVPLEAYVDAFVGTKFEPNGPVVGHDNVKMATSMLDAIFKELAISYLGRYELAQGPLRQAYDDPTETSQDTPPVEIKPVSNGAHLNGVASSNGKTATAVYTDSDFAKAKGYEGDPCRSCGEFKMVKNGTCTKCEACGETSGCS